MGNHASVQTSPRNYQGSTSKFLQVRNESLAEEKTIRSTETTDAFAIGLKKVMQLCVKLFCMWLTFPDN
jgi:hypothetical protein